MELTVLGTSGAYPDAARAASGYLLEHDGFRVVLDLGTGTLSNLQRYIRHEELDAVILTHEHVDHCIDLYPLYTARRFHPEPLARLPVFAPPGVFAKVAALEDDEGRRDMLRFFDPREVEPGSGFAIGPFEVDTRLLPHWVPNAGLRLNADDTVLAYTGDTGPSDEVEALAREAEILVVEASWQDSPAVRPPFHLTARQAAEHAARAEAKRLVLSHFWPGDDRSVSREQAAEAFEGEIVVAEEGARLSLST